MEKHWTESLKAGDEVFAVGRRGTKDVLYVYKRGRKWLTLKYPGGMSHLEHRVEIGRDYVDAGDYSPSTKIYPSQAAYDAEHKRQMTWRAFQTKIVAAYGTPAHVTTEAIHEAARLLGIEISPTD